MFGIFKKNKKKNGMPVDELLKLHKTPIEYATKRNKETYKEEIVGRNGAINVLDGEVFVVCGGVDVYRAEIREAEVSRLMSGNGFVFRHKNIKSGEVLEITVFLAKFLH